LLISILFIFHTLKINGQAAGDDRPGTTKMGSSPFRLEITSVWDLSKGNTYLSEKKYMTLIEILIRN